MEVQCSIYITLTGPRYLHEILQTIVRPDRLDVGDNFILVDDNARPHRTLAVSRYLQRRNINWMQWLAHAWDMFKVAISQRPNQPDTLQDLTEAGTEEWDLLPQDQLDDLVQSLPRRVEELNHVRRGHTHY